MKTSEEIWKPILGFSNHYQASNLGRLKTNNWKNTGREAILKVCDTGGYLQTMIKGDDSKYYTKKVHYLVMLAFVGDREYKEQVINHKDGNKHNNCLNNLEYCSISYNIKHAYANNLIEVKKGSKNGNSKLTEEQINEIREFRKSFPKGVRWGRKACAEKYGISESHLKDIISRRRNIWGHI